MQINEVRSKLPIASFRDVITSTVESHQVICSYLKFLSTQFSYDYASFIIYVHEYKLDISLYQHGEFGMVIIKLWMYLFMP